MKDFWPVVFIGDFPNLGSRIKFEANSHSGLREVEKVKSFMMTITMMTDTLRMIKNYIIIVSKTLNSRDLMYSLSLKRINNCNIENYVWHTVRESDTFCFSISTLNENEMKNKTSQSLLE